MLLLTCTDNEQLTADTLLEVMHEVNILRPEWSKIAEKLGFKQFLKSQNSAKAFLEEWQTFACSSQPSWKQLGIILSTVKEYKQVAVQIQQNDGEHTCCKLIL